MGVWVINECSFVNFTFSRATDILKFFKMDIMKITWSLINNNKKYVILYFIMTTFLSAIFNIFRTVNSRVVFDSA